MSFDSRDPGTSSAEWLADPRLGQLPVFSLTGVDRMIVLAAHPDDETLGAGALLARAFALGIPADVIIVTDGSASHPGSPSVVASDLAATRAAEATEAIALLNPRAAVTFLGFPDGRVQVDRAPISAAISDFIALLPPPTAAAPADAPARTLLVAPWRGDGHRDHRILGEIAAALADEASAALDLVEYPIWLWHWSNPADPATPWTRFTALTDSGALARKRAAIAAYRSQTEPLSPEPGDEALLNPTFLAHFSRPQEVLIIAESAHLEAPIPTLGRDYFDDTYARHDDPWGFTSRWYEERKRAVTLASLPRRHFDRALEIGCSIGVLTEQLAPRTGSLLAVDIAPAAIDRARERLAGHPNVHLSVADVSESFPPGAFDLVLLSEVGYYFDEPTLRLVVTDAARALTADGVFVACHWRHPVADYLQTGDGVHGVIAALAAEAGHTLLTHHLERDFVLDVYSPDPRSVAEQTGLA
ncbi:bifunctional PIG-L family deacetylase/class I SAM-dependent methyltransferase [Subtercola boreus]|uniref:bifunctional PIG-L family deacetylase/class I SAM-dependent methyltransferase n=1 Tax=Subtercola boreus TaxID=120213 RepID=UPI00209BEFF2|nr:bifunctional PIG-L family deacetylase/class I SAM-dependent methyltransferase [Subtercola boreus]